MERQPKQIVATDDKSMVVMLEGHLFDSGLINQILDVLDKNECSFEFKECLVRQRLKEGVPVKSSAILKIAASKDTDLSKVEKKIEALVDVIESAEATFRSISRSDQTISGGTAYVKSQEDKTVLLLGAGRVSASVVDLLGRTKNTTIVVASDNDREAREVARFADRARHTCLDIANDRKRLAELITGADVVISLLPVPMHPEIAELCIQFQKDLVTASYESDAMRKLAQR